MEKLIAQGAEAKIILKDSTITKDRIKKSYRHPELDKQIRKRRTKAETKLLTKSAKIINSPLPLIDSPKSRAGGETFDKIIMPFIEGKKLSEHLDKFPLKKQKEICREIGSSIAKLHKEDIIHGDLTTSNMILKNKIISPKQKFKGGFDKGKLGSLYFIDFGLGYISKKIEDKAVDLHLLKQALEAKHFKNWEILLKEVFNSYKRNCSEAEKVFERIKAVEKRGRYRH